MEQKIKDKRHRLSLYLERFYGLSPLRKLNQGYSYVSDEKGKTVTSVSQVKQGDSLLVYVTALGMTIVKLSKAFVTTGLDLGNSLQLIFAVLLLILGVLVAIQGIKKLLEKPEVKKQ